VLSSPDRALAFARHGRGLAARMAIAGGVLLLEKAFLNLFVDFDAAQSAEGLGAVVRVTQHWAFRFLVSLAIVAAVFGYLRRTPELQQLDAEARAGPLVRPRWLIAHLALVVPLVPLSASLYGQAISLPFGSVVGLWLVLAILASAALFAALAPWELWLKAIRALGEVWWYAGIAAAGAASAMGWSQGLWAGTTQVTFEVVLRLLDRLVPALQVDPANMIIDTGRFAVEIAPVCSGLEGMGLMLAFCAALLLLFRREYIFPRAFLLIPAGLLLSFVLNIARIAGLVLIGNAGYPGVAVYGFHSQAGWIAFNAAAVGIAFVSLRSSWFTRGAASPSTAMAGENPTAVYLLPYLALLLAGMVSRAASGGFESLYWIRLLLASAALLYSWPRLRGVDWRFSWRGGVAGLAAFAAWLITARALPPPQGMPVALAALSPIPRDAWIIGHILASVAVIPLAEELAFRGYLLRRVQAMDFEGVLPTQVRGLALIISAAVFGLCQGVFWLPGMITGVVFGLVYMRTGRLGEAVAAHATGNALLTAVVLGGSQWQLW
jgi:exosortase E/protease (VPEID-CTERM system)